jgi:hypothetical protein
LRPLSRATGSHRQARMSSDMASTGFPALLSYGANASWRSGLHHQHSDLAVKALSSGTLLQTIWRITYRLEAMVNSWVTHLVPALPNGVVHEGTVRCSRNRTGYPIPRRCNFHRSECNSWLAIRGFHMIRSPCGLLSPWRGSIRAPTSAEMKMKPQPIRPYRPTSIGEKLANG